MDQVPLMRHAGDDPKGRSFLAEIEEVCRRHDLSIGFEGHSTFVIEPWSRRLGDTTIGETNMLWLRYALFDVDTE